NESTFSLSQSDAHAAIATAEQLPMMASRRVVRITDFAKLSEDDEEMLLRYVARPAESTALIFVAEDLDKRRKLNKTLMERCAAFEFNHPKEAELKIWLRSYVRSLKAELDEQAMQRIVELVGNDVRILSNELSKLATAALPGARITIDLVDAL